MAIAFDANLGNVTNSTTLTTGAAAASNSRIILAAWWYGTQTMSASWSNAGLSWVRDVAFAATIDGGSNLAFASADAPSGLSSSTVLTPSFSATPAFGPGLAAVSFTGLGTGTSGYVDTTASGVEDFNASWTTGNLVTTMADTLLLCISVGPGASGNTAGGSNTEIHDWITEGTNRAATEYRIVSSASTYTMTGTWAGGPSFQANVALAYEAGGAPPTPPTPLYHTTGNRW